MKIFILNQYLIFETKSLLSNTYDILNIDFYSEYLMSLFYFSIKSFLTVTRIRFYISFKSVDNWINFCYLNLKIINQFIWFKINILRNFPSLKRDFDEKIFIHILSANMKKLFCFWKETMKLNLLFRSLLTY